MFRLVQRAPLQCQGLAIAFLVGSQIDAKLRDALQGWAIVATDQAPLAVTSADLQAARALAKQDAAAPIGLIGFSAGCQSVRTILIANLVKGPLAFVAVFDGTHGSVPPTAWQIDVWKHVADCAREGSLRMIATCSNMSYTKNIPAGQPGRATPTREILEQVLDVTLEPGQDRFLGGPPFQDGGLFAQCFQSEAIDKDAHIKQLAEVLPALLKQWIGGIVEVSPVVDDVPPTPRNDLPTLTFRQRVLAWCKAELAAGVKEEPPGSNDGPRIQEYFLLPDFERDGKPIHITKTAWCAAAACCAWFTCYDPSIDRPPPQARVSGIELERDAREAGRFYTGEGQPGDLAIFKRGTHEWERHVATVLEWEGAMFLTIGGNENNGWAITEHMADNPTLIGFVQVQ